MLPPSHYLASFVLLIALVISPTKQHLSLPIDIGEQLPFETVYQSSSGEQMYPWYAPGIYLLWESKDIATIAPWIAESEEALQAVNEIDFANEAAIAVFHGKRNYTDYAINIEHYGIREENQFEGRIILIAQFLENGPDGVWHPMEGSPYHIIKIKKDSRLTATTNVEMHSYTEYFAP